jgi:hypothetical protein
VFAIYERSADAILRSLADNPDSPPSTIEISVVPNVIEGLAEPGGVHGDGLALLRFPPLPAQRVRWHRREGRWIE